MYTETDFNHLGERQDLFAEDPARFDGAYREMSAWFYLEYGAFNWLTVVADVPFKNVRTWELIAPLAGVEPQQAIRTNYGVSDLRLGGRFPIARWPVALALQSMVKIPLGYPDQPANEGPALGSGEVDVDAQLSVGYSLWPVNAYGMAGLGYRFRGGEFSDVHFFFAEAGGTAGRFLMKARFDGAQSAVDPPDIAGATVITPFPGGVLNRVFVGDQDLYRLDLELGLRLGAHWQVVGQVFHNFAGKDAVWGPTYVLGVVLDG
jgi:hypothetical protein